MISHRNANYTYFEVDVKNIKTSVGLIFIIIILISGCKRESEPPDPSPTPYKTQGSEPTRTPFQPIEPTITTTPAEIIPTNPPTPPPPIFSYGPQNFPDNVNPLTGTEVYDASVLERRPVSFKVNNYPRRDRPQWGLSLSDIVYEYYHNNGIPRFHVIYYGLDTPQVGPIRSARMFDDYLISTYKSIFVFASADSRILTRLNSQNYADRLLLILDGVCPPRPVCRFQPQFSNYLVGDSHQVGVFADEEGIDNARQNLDGMLFDPNTPAGGELLDRVYVRYSVSAYTYWEYDPVLRRNLRYQDTQEDLNNKGEDYALMTDRQTGDPITAANVVVLIVPHFFAFHTPASEGTPATEVVDMDFTGTGQAYIFRDGKLFNVKWENKNSILTLKYPDGSHFPFKPGNTWFEVVSTISTLEKGDSDWRFQFFIK
jgi:hypothetical protein